MHTTVSMRALTSTGDGLLRVLGMELVGKWCLGPEALASAVAGTQGESVLVR